MIAWDADPNGMQRFDKLLIELGHDVHPDRPCQPISNLHDLKFEFFERTTITVASYKTIEPNTLPTNLAIPPYAEGCDAFSDIDEDRIRR